MAKLLKWSKTMKNPNKNPKTQKYRQCRDNSMQVSLMP